MRNLLLVTACVLISACSQPAKVTPQVQPLDYIVDNDCYTVDLFTEVKIEKPDTEVPEANQQFLGEWGGGAWNDVWCHGLLVNKVYADGRVDLVDMHAPYEPWSQPATAFRRVGRIDDKGNLRFAHGTSRLSYRIENGKLIGTNSGLYGDLTVELVHLGTPPIPTPNPVRATQLASVAKTGG
jgi:hypothetical protein